MKNINNNRKMNSRKPEQIEFFSLGNGISVCDINREVNGDYKRVAHISKYREVEFFGKISDESKNKILQYAKTANPMSSAAQNDPVFIKKTFKYIVHFKEKARVCYAYNLEHAFAEAEVFARRYGLFQDFIIKETGEFIDNPPYFGIREPL